MTLGKKANSYGSNVVVTEHKSGGAVRTTTSQWEHQDLAHVRIRCMRGHNDTVKSVQFCDHDTKYLTASHDRSMILWNFDNGKSIYIYEGGHDTYISQARMSSQADRIVSSGWDKKVNLWDALTGQVTWTGRHGGIVTCCNYSHDDQYVVSASDLDNTIKIWDVRDGKAAFEIKDLHEDTITSVAFTLANDRLLTTSMDNTSKLYDLRAQCNTITLKGHINVVSDATFTGDERKFATVSYDKSIRFYDVSTGTYRSDGPVVIDKAHEGCISSVDFSTDGLLLVTAGFDGAVCVWDVENYIMKLRLLGHVDWVETVCFSTDQRWLLSGGKDQTVRLWNIEDTEMIPMVMEKKKAIGMKVFKCAKCGKPFSQKTEDGEEFARECVFCRVKSNESVNVGGESTSGEAGSSSTSTKTSDSKTEQ